MNRLNEIELVKVLDAAAVSNSDIDTIFNRYGIDYITEKGRSLLNIAVIHNNVYLVKKCVMTQGCDLNFQERESGYSALHFAVENNNLAIVKLLVENGASIDCVDIKGNTPLWRAAFDDVDEELILYLVDNGADVTRKNHNSLAPQDILET